MPEQPIFHDPEQKRWRKIRWLLILAVGFLLTLLASLASSLTHVPQLGSLPLKVNSLRRIRGVSEFQHSSKEPAYRILPIKNNAQPTQTIGFYVNWDDNSFVSLKENLTALDVLMPEWLHLAKGAVQLDDLHKQQQALEYIQRNKPNLKVVPLINNYDGDLQRWDSAGLSRMLASKAQRSKIIGQLQMFVGRYRLAGINIDFEEVPTAAQGNLLRFMRELYARFHPLGLEVSQDVPLDDNDFNYKALARNADHLILMAYDEHEAGSAAGPIASQGWLQKNLEGLLKTIPADKLTVALGNYAYDWTMGKSGADELSFQEAITLSQKSGSPIRLDARSLNPTFDYYDASGHMHQVWLLDAVSTQDQLSAAERLGLHRVALWRMGTEDPTVWRVLAHKGRLGSDQARELQALRYGYDIDYQGQGEVLKITSQPKTGSREIGFDAKTGLITSERYSQYASPYVITRWGNAPKKIALTFDDGPDPTYTPQILDILKRYHAPATFFIIGIHGEMYPDLLHRIVQEGHEIGNHTFTHPNVALVSPRQFDLELAATQRLLEGELGRDSLLFRPPYAEDIEPETPDQASPVARASGLGYYTIGLHIDPLDWANPGVQKIVDATLEQADTGNGNVVLLHDAGGNRAQTVAALPKIIEGLRARDYELVGVSELLGLPHDAVMPKVTAGQRLLVVSEAAGFRLLAWLSRSLHWLFVLGIVLSVSRLLLIVVLALLQAYRKRPKPSSHLPTVSIVIPAYNEEKVILKTVRSLLAQTYPAEIILVDDGSKDQTLQQMQEIAAQHPQIQVFSLPNGGKAKALNHGLRQAMGEVVVCLDADTLLEPRAVEYLVAHFAQPEVVAVAGNAKVGNRLNLMTRWQALEYITSQNLERRALERLNSITVVPGAIGAWRRTVLLEQGGFSHDTLAEDADLTLRLLRLGYRVVYEPKAIAYTEAPDTVRAFLKQRFRWMYGTLQAAWKNRDVLFKTRFGALGIFTLPNVFLFQIAFPFISPLMDLFLVTSLAWTALQWRYHPASGPSEPNHALLFYGLFTGVDLLAALIAFILEKREDSKLLFWLFPQRFFYRQLLYIVAIRSAVVALKGSAVGWGKLVRKATVQEQGIAME